MAKLIRCWFDNSDQDEKICIQKRRTAKLLISRKKHLPFPQCLKCKSGMEKKYQESEPVEEKPEPKKARYTKAKRNNEYCLNCGGLMPEDAPRNRLYCSLECREKQKEIKRREWAKQFRKKQLAGNVKTKPISCYRYSVAAKEFLEENGADNISTLSKDCLDAIYDRCYMGKKKNQSALLRHKRVLDAIEREMLSGCNLFEKIFKKLPSGQMGRVYKLKE